MGKFLVAFLAICLSISITEGKPAPDSDNPDDFDRSMRFKSLLHELDGLPDKELRDLLLQLKNLRKLRMQSATRNVADIPVGKLTEEELNQVSNSVPPSERKKSHYIPLDIPHDLIRVSVPKTLEAFGVPRLNRGNKDLGEDSNEENDEEKRQETSFDVREEESEWIDALEDIAALLNSQLDE